MRRLLLCCILVGGLALLLAAPGAPVHITTALVRLTSHPTYAPTGSVAIAHALGVIDGQNYTNSREAFEHSYALGYRDFEVDLMAAADGQLVAAHNSGPLQREFGTDQRVADMTAATFRAKPLMGRYTALVMDDLLDLLEQYPDARLLLDVKNNDADPRASFAAIHRRVVVQARARDPQLLQRLVPFLYDPAEVDAVRDYPTFVYALYRSDIVAADVAAFVARTPAITAVAFEHDQFSVALVRRLHARGVQVYVHTLNDAVEAQAFVRLGADGIITDVLHPTQP